MPRGDEHNPASRSEHARRMLEDWYHAPSGPPPGGAATWDALPPDIIRVQLTAEWITCEDGQGVELTLNDAGQPVQGRAIALRDPIGIMQGQMLWDEATWSVPSGLTFWAIATYDGPAPDAEGPYYEPFDLGSIVCGSGSGSGSAGSGSAGSGSGGSGSGSGGGGTGNCPCPPVCAGCNKLELVQTGTNIHALCISDNGQITGWWDHSDVWHSPSGCPDPGR